MIEQAQLANMIPGFVSVGILFVGGVLVAVFARPLFWAWLNLLRLAGERLARALKADRNQWVPQVPSAKMVRIEVAILRVTGIVVAVCAVLIIVIVLG